MARQYGCSPCRCHHSRGSPTKGTESEVATSPLPSRGWQQNMVHPKCTRSVENPIMEQQTCGKGPKLGFECLPTNKTLHCGQGIPHRALRTKVPKGGGGLRATHYYHIMSGVSLGCTKGAEQGPNTQYPFQLACTKKKMSAIGAMTPPTTISQNPGGLGGGGGHARSFLGGGGVA